MIWRWSIIMVALSPLWACARLGEIEPQGSPQASLQSDTPGVPGSQERVRRRRAREVRNVIAKALNLHKQGMCLELGRIPCADEVHHVSLGGMDPYRSSLYSSPVAVSVTAPASLERLVLSACIQRAGLDIINNKQAVIFKDIELSVDGRLVQSPQIDAAIDRLYQRAFIRRATNFEIARIKRFYQDVYAQSPKGAARNWMVLSCFAVLSSLESVVF